MTVPTLLAAPAAPSWWIVAACVVTAALSTALAASLWIGQRSRQATLARLAAHRRAPAWRLADVDLGAADALLGDGDVPPWRRQLAATLARWIPSSLLGPDAVAQVARAGHFSSEAVLYYAAARLLAVPLAPALVLAVVGRVTPMVLAIGLLVGFVGPRAVLDRMAGTRRSAIAVALPDAIDLLIICLEAGVGLDSALVRVARELSALHPVLAAELEYVMRRTGAGLPREEALRALVTRTGVDDLRSIVTTMVQAERLGTSLARVLRIHAEALRTRRKQLAEKKAAQASVKMVIPLVLFLLPAFFAVVLGPAVLSMIGMAHSW